MKLDTHNGNHELGEVVFAYRENSSKSFEEIAAVLGRTKNECAGAYYRFVERKTKSETNETVSETGKNTDSANEGKNAIIAAENPVSPVSETRNAVSFWRKIVSQFSLMHLVFYVTTATGCYAIYDTLPNIIGAALLTIFGLFSLDSILKAQDSARPEIAAYGRNRVIFSELIAAVAHYSILNKYLWQNLKSLPFEVKLLPPKGGNFEIDFRGQILNGVWHGGEMIFIISIIISGLIFVAAFAAVDSVLRENKTI